MLKKLVDYTTVDGTQGSIAPAKIHRIARMRSLVDKTSGQHIVMANGELNCALLNSLPNGIRSSTSPWITVIYTNAGRQQIRVIDDYKEIQEKMEVTLSSYHL